MAETDGNTPSTDDSREPGDAGVYAVVFHLDGDPKVVSIGALGDLEFAPGYYAYVGSALSGLRSRIGRHLDSGPKNLHWHIDYLAHHTRPVRTYAWLTHEKLECRLSDTVRNMAEYSVHGFGASDCDCASHLHFFLRDPGDRLQNLPFTGRDGTLCPLRIFPETNP